MVGGTLIPLESPGAVVVLSLYYKQAQSTHGARSVAMLYVTESYVALTDTRHRHRRISYVPRIVVTGFIGIRSRQAPSEHSPISMNQAISMTVIA